MEIKDNFSIFNLFLEKKVKIQVDGEKFYLTIPSIKEFSLNDEINAMYHIWILPNQQRQKIIPIPCETSFDFINTILFKLGIYKEYSNIVLRLKEALVFFLPEIEINYKEKQLIVDNITITEEI